MRTAGRPGSFDVPADHEARVLVERSNPRGEARPATVRVRPGAAHSLRRRASATTETDSGWSELTVDFHDVDGFADGRDGEVWLVGVHIPEYTEGTWTNHAPRRPRKLLLHKKEINRLLAPLDDREREILKLRFGLDRGEPRTLEEVGEHFNLTRERIRQIEARAMSKLRHPSSDTGARDLLAV